VSLTPAITYRLCRVSGDYYRRCRFYQQLINRQWHGINENTEQGFITGVNNTGDKFSPGNSNNDTGDTM